MKWKKYFAREITSEKAQTDHIVKVAAVPSACSPLPIAGILFLFYGFLQTNLILQLLGPCNTTTDEAFFL